MAQFKKMHYLNVFIHFSDKFKKLQKYLHMKVKVTSDAIVRTKGTNI